MREPFRSVPGRRRRPGLPVSASALVAAIALVLAGCGGSDGESDSAEDGLTTVDVGVIPILDVAPIYLGVEQGFFEQEGLSLNLQTAQGGAAIIPGVVSGQYGFGFSNTVSLLVGVSQGLPLKVVAEGVATTGEVGNDFGAVVVPQDSPITTAADLAGASIAVNTLQNINTTTTNKVVRDDGGDPSSIEYTELPYPEIAAAVAAGDVDAGQLVEPFLTIGKQQGLREVASNFAGTDPNLTVALYFTTQQFATEKPDVVEGFTAAMERSTAYASDHPEAARDILTSYTEIDPQVREAMVLPRWPDTIDPAPIEVLSRLALADGLISTEPDLTQLLP